jgi:hypothetical protein
MNTLGQVLVGGGQSWNLTKECCNNLVYTRFAIHLAKYCSHSTHAVNLNLFAKMNSRPWTTAKITVVN